jgi:hypothetical protein
MMRHTNTLCLCLSVCLSMRGTEKAATLGMCSLQSSIPLLFAIVTTTYHHNLAVSPPHTSCVY